MRFVIFIIISFMSFLSYVYADEPKLKLPDYYLGAWEATADNYIYVIKDNGTITGYYNFDKNEKYTNMTYRVLDVRKDSAVLFVREVELKHAFTGKPNTKPFYAFWTLKPYKLKIIKETERMWIELGNLRPGDRPSNPDEKSDRWWLDYYNKDDFYEHYHSLFSHIRLPPGSFQE